MTNRMDHTDCSHEATTRARTSCRTGRRDVLRAAQRGFMDADIEAITWDAYRELVCTVALRFNIEVRDAYELIENGPVV